MRPVARIPFRLEVEGRVVRGDVRFPPARAAARADGGEWAAAILVCHGFKGFKDWGFFPPTCEELALRVGCPVVGFNFSGAGVGPELGRFSDPRGFSRNTFSRELEDLEAVLDGVEGGRLGEVTLPRPGRIGLLGHSRGAIAASLAGVRRPAVRALVTWGGLARPDRYAQLFPPDPAPDHVAEVRNLRTGEILPLRRDVLDDLRDAGPRLDPIAALGSADLRLLVVHGELDDAVPTDDARHYATAGGESELLLLPGTGHTFDVRHPYLGSTPAFERAIGKTAAHFRTHLTRED